MRLRSEAVSLCFLIAAMLVAVPANAKTISLNSNAEATGIRLVESTPDGVVLELTLPSIELEELKIAHEVWQRFTFDGSVLAGIEGQAALPIISRSVAIPDDVGVNLRVLGLETVELKGYRLAPVEGREGEPVVVDGDWYAKSIVSASPDVIVGDPAIMRDLRVVSVTFRPVVYDPISGTVKVAHRMTIALDFTGKNILNASVKSKGMITESFDSFYKSNVLNYDSSTKSLPVELGTYLVICPDNSTVINNLEPLLNWRKRQGYNIVLATTSVTGTSNTQIKNYLQTQYDTVNPALEFVTLVGDVSGTVAIPSWTESLSGYGGGGDHYYTQLEGSDILADIHIGRLSVENTAELTTVVNKIVNYESSPPITGDTGWFKRATLVGDPDASGITTIFVNQWVKNQLLHHGYTQVDTVWGGNFVTEMLNKFGAGGTLFTYRGWLGMSGISSSYIMNLANTDKLGFAVIITCDTGSFVRDGNCRSEAFLRAPNGGGVASVGTATAGTHTRYNNCVFTAVIDHAWNSGDYRVGPALTSSKLAMYNNYNVGEPDKVEVWSVWNNLMGDPCTEIWTDFPGELTLSYDANLSLDATSARITVDDQGTGLPLQNAIVTLYKDGEIQTTAMTAADGSVNLALSAFTAGDMDLTVRKHNFMPAQRIIVLGGTTELVSVQTSIIDDTNWGDSDGQLEAGEHVEMGLLLINQGTVTAPGTTASLSSNDPYVTIQSNSVSYGDISSGGTTWGAGMFEITVAADAPGGHDLQLELTVISGPDTWHDLVEQTVQGPAFNFINHTFGGAGGTMDPGENGSVTVSLYNDGNATAASTMAVLSTESPWVTITDTDGYFGDINFQQTGDNTGDTFTIAIGSNCYPGHLAPFRLDITTSGGATSVLEFTAPVGSAVSTDPVGPDSYGYYAYDDTDTTHPEAPTFDWVEIDPTLGGSGVSVGLNDTGWEGDDTNAFTMPFPFTFYGESFDTISICSNGWLSMGVTDSKQYRNWALPTAGAADGMIAGFWDNLFRSGSLGGVFTWYDMANHRLIVEWSRMRTMWYQGSTGPEETFEIILYDPAFYPTDSGDGIIDVQYNVVNNGDVTNGYATAGLMNLDHTAGLTYEYWNTPAAGAAQLQSGRAIRYLPYHAVSQGTLQGTVTNDVSGTPIEGVLIEVQSSLRSTVTDALGQYSLGMPAGPVTLDASEYFYQSASAGATVTTGVTTTLHIALTALPTVTLTGMITPTVPLSVGGARITPIDVPLGGAVAALDGSWSIPGVPVGLSMSLLVDGVRYFGADYLTFTPFDAGGEIYPVHPELRFTTQSFASTGGWSPFGSSWSWGTPSTGPAAGWSPPACWGVGMNSNYPDSEAGSLQSPATTFWTGDQLHLSFHYWSQTEEGGDGVQLRILDGIDYTVLEPLTGYTHASIGGLNNKAGWSGDSGGWVGAVFDLTSWIGQPIVLNFLFGSNEAVNDVGFFIDDVTFDTGNTIVAIDELGPPPGGGLVVTSHPNPFNPATTIRWRTDSPGRVQVMVHDMRGRVVRALLDEDSISSSGTIRWDGQDDSGHSVATGTYLVRVIDGGGTTATSRVTLIK